MFDDDDIVDIYNNITYTKGFNIAAHPLHLMGSYGNGAGIFSILFNGVYLNKKIIIRILLLW
jgi:hypothetical protein